MKRFLLFLFIIAQTSVNANAETYTHTFNKGELTTVGGTITLSDIDWNATAATYIDWNATKGIQIGSKSTLCTSYTLSTSGFAGCKIRSITVNSSIAASGDAKLTIEVGNQTSEAYTLKTSDAAYTFDCDDTTGDITINWTATARAYYVKSITIDYTPNASTVVIPTPEFKTPAVIYADKVENVTVETADQSAVLYYTTDGTDPVYEDWVNETGSTKSSKYYVMYFDLTATTTIKAMAVRTDGDAVFKSDIAEQTYIVSRTMPYVTTSDIVSGNKYAMVAADSAACYFYGEKAYGYLPTKTALTANERYIETVECAGFTFTATEGGYTIQDELGRYVYHSDTYTSFNYASEKPATGAVWNVSIDNNGNATISTDGYTILYSTEYCTFGCYPADKVTENHQLPKLYMQREYPTYTISPEAGSTLNQLDRITVTCPEGISAEDLTATVEGYEISVPLTCTQVDDNTIMLAASTPITSLNNTNLQINIAGDIMLNPEGMNMALPITSKYGVRTLASYTLEGYAPAATIIEVSPADGETVEELSHFIFTFSYYAGHTDDTSIRPKLYAEGKEWSYALEMTTENKEGGMIKMDQAALKTTEPLIGNGTYYLEIPTGYFVDGNGKTIEGMTFRYIVKNDSGEIAGIEDVVADGNNGWTVYGIAGQKILDTTDAESLKALPAGIYIVNGVKVLIK